MEIRSPLAWLDDPSESCGVRVTEANGEWSFVSYHRLAQRCRRFAAGLIGAGLRRNEIVAICGRSNINFITALLGAMRAGVTASVIAPPAGIQDYRAHETQVRGMLTTLRPAALIADDDLVGWARMTVAPEVSRVLPYCEMVRRGEHELRDGRSPADLALIQFSSGSTGCPRGIRIPFDALCSNIAAIRAWLRAGAADEWASWLPLHHDMGLIGCVLAPITGGNSFWLMRPREFMRQPERFVRCFAGEGATITATPCFGLEHIARRVTPSQLSGLDLSGWRAIVVGAERIDPRTLTRFHDLLGARGLARSAILPAYGLAEATLAVSGLALDRTWRSVPVNRDWRMGGNRLDAHGVDPREEIVGCGGPVAGMTVRVLDDAGNPLAEGKVGEIEVSGSSMATGYWAEDVDKEQFANQTLRTGDVGFIEDGEVFVIGRLGDSVKVRGRALFAEDIELRLADLGLPPYRYAGVLGYYDGMPTLVAVLEDADNAELARADLLLRPYRADCRTIAVTVPKGFIPRTSSGKKRRRELWETITRKRLVKATLGKQPVLQASKGDDLG